MMGIILFVVFLVIDYFLMGVSLAWWVLFMRTLDKFEAKEKKI
jgi:hypothetical protein